MFAWSFNTNKYIKAVYKIYILPNGYKYCCFQDLTLYVISNNVNNSLHIHDLDICMYNLLVLNRYAVLVKIVYINLS